MVYLYLLIKTIIGGTFYRFRGGWPDIPKPIEQTLFCSILIYAMYASGLFYVHVGLFGILAIIAASKGHGNNMDLGHYDFPSDPEWYEVLIQGYKGALSVYWYEALGMLVSGLTITGGVGLAISFQNPMAGLVIGLSGALKAPAYMIGWAVHPLYDNGKLKMSIGKFKLTTATEWGEFLTGSFIWGVVGYVLLSGGVS